MQYRKFRIFHLLLAILVFALILASLVEQQEVIGKSTSRSPDGNWCLDLELVEHSTFFTSRKTLKACIDHSTNRDWDVSTSIPFNDADAKTISNLDEAHPIVWSDDSSTVSYWVNKKLEDSMKVETDGGQFKFQRKLYSLSVTHTPAENGG